MSRVGRVAQIVLGFVLVAAGGLWILFWGLVALIASGFGGTTSDYLFVLEMAGLGLAVAVVGTLLAYSAARRAT